MPSPMHLGRLAAGGGDDLVADNQQAIIVARRELLDDDVLAFGQRGLIGGHDLLARGEVRGHAAALVAVLRLDDDRHADLAGGLPGVVGIGDRPALGHGHAHRLQQRPRQFLVLGDGFGDGAGAVGLGGANAALLAAVAELHQAFGVHPPRRNAAGGRRIDDRAGARAQADVLGEIAEPARSRPATSNGRS